MLTDPDPFRTSSWAGRLLKAISVAAMAVLALTAAMNLTAAAALVHPMLGAATLPIAVAAALSATEAVLERSAPGILCALRVFSRGVRARLTAE